MFLLCSNVTLAQTMPPKWKTMGIKDLRSSYIEVVSGDDVSTDKARNKAAQEIVRRRNLTTDGNFNVQVVNGVIYTSGNRDIIVSSRILDEYIEKIEYGNYRVYLLVQTLKHPSFNYENVTVTEDYPFSARAFIPGLDQMYKGHTTKGIIFITAEAICLGGALGFENSRAGYEDRMNEYISDQERYGEDRRSEIENMRDIMRSKQEWRNIFLFAAAGVYVWNIIDAISCKGPRYVNYVSLTPYAGTESAGLVLNINF